MKGRSNLLIRIVISLAITILFTLAFFKLEKPYVASIADSFPFESAKSNTYLDINNDGRSERILLSMPGLERTSLLVYDDRYNIIDQVNLSGRFVKRSDIFSGDYNMDGISELFVFTYLGDSLFLNVIDAYNLQYPIKAIRYIDGCKTLDGEAEYMISGIVLQDRNGDGNMEIYFSISAGFTLQPRALYCYDIKNDVLDRSELAGVAPRYYLNSADLDGDGSLEMWGRSNAFGNYKEYIPYSDSSAWAMVFKSNLEFFFKPIEFRGYTSIVNIHLLGEYPDWTLLVDKNNRSRHDSIENELILVSLEGEILQRKVIGDAKPGRDIKVYIHNNMIYYLDGNGLVYVFDDKLRLQKTLTREWSESFYYGQVEQEDGLSYIIFLSPRGMVHIATPELKLLASVPVKDGDQYPFRPVSVSNLNSESGFHIRTAHFDYLISFERNARRNYIILYSGLIFLIFYAFIWFIQYLQYRQEEKKRKIESQMRTLQLQSVKSQMSPHFIFNALNSISAMYIKGDTERADSFLTSFSRMIREVVDSSDRIIVELNEEIRFVKSYLELQKVRYGERLDYSIKIQEECSKIMVPSMSIHTFVENSIKHGFPEKETKMNIRVDAVCGGGIAEINVTDNGIGLKNSKSPTKREGKGTKLITDIFEAYYSIYRKRIRYSLTDLSEEGKGNTDGTLVRIEIEL